ncbi:hypothetical protein [Legionella brunensis]|uniref:Uncharacterized protein n=1 Tax=Legionella brunensis TaxID=29422 RepID=A0A0W0SPM1_9GAMM|nr:hypothetical protein [Legionella brunensis]KTC85161.1 hypothetical protein Lbru_0957 [Legionella brunensis]
MRRKELSFSNEQVIDFLYQGYQIKAIQLEFIDIGSFYGFIVTTKDNKKLFLKIHPQD